MLAVVSILGFALDIGTKLWAEAALERGVHVPVLGNLLSFVLVYNKGAVFGLNPGVWMPWMPVNAVFSVFMIAAMVVVLLYYRSSASDDRLVRWGLALVMPGALGNLYDRIVRPGTGVVDFIMVDLGVWPADPWPVFNFADMYVTVGVGFILLSLALEEWRRRKTGGATSPNVS